jgi:hypothetical protein
VPLWFRILRLWLPIAVVATALLGFTYVASQQVYRNLADEPQTQLAEDAAARLDAGDDVSDVVSGDTVNLASSLAPFVIVYDMHDAVAGGNGVLEGKTPLPPTGVLDTARSEGRNRLTWQPAKDVRIASVSVATKDGRVVLAGRSLRQTEQHVDDLTAMAFVAWVVTLAGALIAVVLVELVGKRWTAA